MFAVVVAVLLPAVLVGGVFGVATFWVTAVVMAVVVATLALTTDLFV